MESQVDAIKLAILGLSKPVLAGSKACTPLTAIRNHGNEQGDQGTVPDEVLKARRSWSTKSNETEGALEQEGSREESGYTHPIQIILCRCQGR